MWEVYQFMKKTCHPTKPLSFARIQLGWDGSIDINFHDLTQIVVATKALQLIMKSLVHVTWMTWVIQNQNLARNILERNTADSQRLVALHQNIFELSLGSAAFPRAMLLVEALGELSDIE